MRLGPGSSPRGGDSPNVASPPATTSGQHLARLDPISLSLCHDPPHVSPGARAGTNSSRKRKPATGNAAARPVGLAQVLSPLQSTPARKKRKLVAALGSSERIDEGRLIKKLLINSPTTCPTYPAI